jgi:prepilin-type N-terminal cleavage/methylation domain-containing protein
MRKRGTGKRGFTLVELLVVIGIITIMAAVAIPTFIKAGAFQKQYIEQSGRTVYNLLKAGEYYASTYNVETCIAYAAEEQLDSVTGQPAVVARSLGVFRRATDAELVRWEAIHGVYGATPLTSTPMDPEELSGEVKVFVPVAEYELTELDPGACVLGEWLGDVDPPLYSDFWAEVPGYPAKGLEPVRIRTEEGPPPGFAPDPIYDGVMVRPYLNYPNPDAPSMGGFWPAHVFMPAGYINTSIPEERLVVNVGATLDSDIDDRFVDVDPGDLPAYVTDRFPGYTADIYPIQTTRVQVTKSSARVKIIE